MDTDLEQMTREELVAEVQKLRRGIREHRDSSRHELCEVTRVQPPNPAVNRTCAKSRAGRLLLR